jgi:hypothetical protein
MSQSNPLQPSVFLERVILALLPYFLPLAANLQEARAEIRETLAAYAPRTRAEMINIQRIIAFSFASLDLLAESQAEDMSQAMRLRYTAQANSLNRSCQRDENTLAARQAHTEPASPEAIPRPMTDAELEAATSLAHRQVAQARAAVSAAIAREYGNNPPPWAIPDFAPPTRPPAAPS